MCNRGVVGNNARNNGSVGDECYTSERDVYNELKHWGENGFFVNKSILCPCDDPLWSSFVKVLVDNFDEWGIREINTVGFAYECKAGLYFEGNLFVEAVKSGKMDEKELVGVIKNPMSGRESKNLTKGRLYTFNKRNIRSAVKEFKKSDWKKRNINYTVMEGDGSFNNPETRALAEKCDIIITNPPFSLVSSDYTVGSVSKQGFFNWLKSTKKDFICLAYWEAPAYVSIIDEFVNKRAFWGYGTPGIDALWFETPCDPGSVNTESKSYRINENGKVEKKVCSVWLTSFKPKDKKYFKPNKCVSEMFDYKRVEEVDTCKLKGKFGCNFKALVVKGEYVNIPFDYNGIICISLTAIPRLDPDTYNLIGFGKASGSHDKAFIQWR